MEAHRPAPPPAAFTRTGVDPRHAAAHQRPPLPCRCTLRGLLRPQVVMPPLLPRRPAPRRGGRPSGGERDLRDGLLPPASPLRRRCHRRHARGMPVFFEERDDEGCRGDMLHGVLAAKLSYRFLLHANWRTHILQGKKGTPPS